MRVDGWYAGGQTLNQVAIFSSELYGFNVARTGRNTGLLRLFYGFKVQTHSVKPSYVRTVRVYDRVRG